MSGLSRRFYFALCAIGVAFAPAAGCGNGCTPSVRGSGPEVIRCAAAGCAVDDRKPIVGGTLRVHMEAEPTGLCDLVNHESWVRWIVENQVMESLVEQDAVTGVISPRLAQSWQIVGEGALRTWVFHLRDGVRFHDGHPFGATDVAFTLGRARDPALAADQRSDLAPIVSIDTPDEHTVILHVPGPAPFLMQVLAHIVIYPRHLLDGTDLRTASFCRAPVGTGPFRFASWQSGVRISIERARDYWGKAVAVDGVEFRIVRDRQAAWLLYRRGELDVMWRLPSDVVATAEHDGQLSGHRLYRQRLRSFFFVLWNTRRPALRDPKVREGLAHLVDWPRLIELGFSGRAQAHSGPYIAGTPSYDDSVLPWSYDPQLAKHALENIADRPTKLTFLSTTGSASVDQLATLLEEDLRRIGIELVVEKLDFAQLLDRLHKHDFDVTAMQLTMVREQDNFGLFHSSAANEQNWAGLADPEIDRVLERIRATDDDAQRHTLDRELHRLLHERGPMSFLLVPEVETAVRAGWGGIRASADGLGLANAHRVAP